MSKSNDSTRILSAGYWRAAAAQFTDLRILVVAAMIAALRIALKFLNIPLAAGLEFSFDCYVNSVGSLVYGPLVGLAVGAISDTLGCILHPTGVYFLPFILVEMSSSFLFGLFLWRQKLTLPRVMLSKFTVNFVCNIILTSLFSKWMWALGLLEAKTYSVINLVRIVKNLVLFPIEAILIVAVLQAVVPALRRLHLPVGEEKIVVSRKQYLWAGLLLLLSVALVLFYIFFLKDFVSAHNIKWL